jgi:hypothetical protein
MSEALNPYAAPSARVEDLPAVSEAEAIRRAHISHEASIKAVGLLDYLAGAVLLFAAAGTARSAPGALLLAALGIGLFFAGWGVRALQSWGRIAGIVLAALGLLGFPIGTVINGYILYLLLSKKGRTIFSPEYQEVIAATPHVKYRTSIVVWVFLLLLAGLVVFAGVSAFVGR